MFDRGRGLKFRQAWKQGQTGIQTQATAVDRHHQELSAPRPDLRVSGYLILCAVWTLVLRRAEIVKKIANSA